VTPDAPLEHEGPLAGPDVVVGVAGSMTAGPGVRFSLRLSDDVIVDARFETCRLDDARGAADALCGLIVGATVDDASQFSVLDVARVGSLSPTSPAARTVHFAKSAALQPLLGRRARHGASITCTCFRVPTDLIVATIRRHHVQSVDDLRRHLPATTGCGTCRPDVQRLIDAAR
jgi:bacterioferritin-associated ferredoxin/NifU-like protein involved in Fe-S cluster formation